MLKRLCAIWFKRNGWLFTGHIPKKVRKVILVGGPFTSRQDFLIALAVSKLAKFRVKILVDKHLFWFPLGWILRSNDAVPYDPQDEKALSLWLGQKFGNRKNYAVLLSPEGTRERTDTWNTGFYDAAVKHHIPICLVSLDYSRKLVKFHSWFHASGDKERDMDFIRNFISQAQGKHPERGIHRPEKDRGILKDYLDER